jgi:predicted Zn-dependent protease
MMAISTARVRKRTLRRIFRGRFGSEENPHIGSDEGRLVSPTALVCLVLLFGILGCARNPVSGRPEPVLTTEESEIAYGNQASRQVAKEIGLVENAELAAYIDSVGQRLASHSPRGNLRYHFQVVEMAEPNAFALPGGHVYVSRGLLSLINTESELAAILGHELGHVAARHSVQRQTASVPLMPLQIASALGAAAAAVVSPALGEMVANAGFMPTAFALAAYSREQERQADRLGQEFAAAAGFDPSAMATFMQTLAREEALSESGGTRTSFLSSHPSSPDRSQDASEFSRNLEMAADQPAPLGRAAFLREFDGILVGTGAGEGVAIGNRFLHPELGIALAFPEGWRIQNLRDAVNARSEDAQAQVTLEIVARGEDPMEAALAFGRELRLDNGPRALEIHGNPAARANLRFAEWGNARRLSLTWIAFDGLIYRFTGISSPQDFPPLLAVFEESADSFHGLLPGERAEVEETRLRLVTPLPGEALESLGERSGNRWSLERTALSNGIEATEPLDPDHPIKIAHPEPYLGPEERGSAKEPAPASDAASEPVDESGPGSRE